MHEKTSNLQCFRPGLTQTGTYGYRSRLKNQEKRDCIIYIYSENKAADQLCSYLRLCFRICKSLVFWDNGSFYIADHSKAILLPKFYLFYHVLVSVVTLFVQSMCVFIYLAKFRQLKWSPNGK